MHKKFAFYAILDINWTRKVNVIELLGELPTSFLVIFLKMANCIADKLNSLLSKIMEYFQRSQIALFMKVIVLMKAPLLNRLLPFL